MSSKSLILSLTLSVFSYASVFAQTPSAPQPPFEGTISYSIAMPAMGTDKSEMRTYIKGNKSYTEIDMGAMGTQKLYIDQDKKTVLSVSEAQKVGYEADLTSDTTTRMTDFKATGTTKTIDGYASQEFTGAIKNMILDIWATPDLPISIKTALQRSMLNNAQNAGANGFGELAAKGLAPVSMTIILNGNKVVTMELEKYEAKPLNDTIFVPASNIKINHLTPAQIKQMQSGAAGGH